MIVVARDRAVGLAPVTTQAPARDALRVLAIDLSLQRLGTALPGQNAIKALAEVLATTVALILADRKPEQHPAQADTFVPDPPAHLVFLAQGAPATMRAMGLLMAVKVVNNRVQTARPGNCETRQVQRNIKVRHPRQSYDLSVRQDCKS